MKPTYEVRLNSDGEEIIIQTNSDGTIWSFLSDPANSDYQRYLAWLEDPNAEITPPIL